MCNPKPDDRSDNAEKIKKSIESTKRNIEAANEMIPKTSNEKNKKDLEEKNKRRLQAIPGMEREMKQEMEHQK